jgi:MarR family transcriptional regulator, organic hydroperoxide resistance regulator
MSNARRAQQMQSLIHELRRFIANAILFNQQVADKLGINATDHQVLNLLELRGGATPGELARLTALTTGGVTLSLDRLERAGYIRREKNPRDRRSLLIRPVPEKLRDVRKFYRPIDQGLARLFSSYSDKEVAAILEFFEQANNTPRPGASGRQNKL